MLKAIEQFRENISRVRELGAIYTAVKGLVTAVVDMDDLLRTQIVLAVSALDHLVHELCRLGMLESIGGIRPRTSAFLKFPLTISTGISAVGGDDFQMLLDSEVRRANSYKSFQMPDKIADAVRLYSDVALWQEVGATLGIPSEDVKKKLALIIDRRNKIAHEADLDPSFVGQRWPIDSALASEVVDFIGSVGEAIYRVSI